MTSPVVLVTAVGEAEGSRAAAAALACAGSEPDRAGLLIDVGARPPRPTLLASTGAQELEERLAVHLPGLRAASRGQTCHLAVGPGEEAFASIAATLPLVRDSVAVVHVPPGLFRAVLDSAEIAPTAVLLRADLTADRALAALAVADLLGRGLRVAVLKQSLAWVTSRVALFGLGQGDGGLPGRLVKRLLAPLGHECYAGEHGTEAHSTRTPQQERRDHASPR